jgi:hypothetical protein
MKKVLLSITLAIAATCANAATLNPVQLLNPAGSTSGQAIVSTGPSTAPAWGNVTATSLAAQAANTVVANVTAASASPTAVALPSCSTANSALKYTSASGLSCGTTYALTTGNLSQFAATTSAQLLGVISDETGTGALVFGTSPTIGTATLNTPTISGGTINNATLGITTPLAAKVTTLQATSTITPSSTAGIVGTTTNDSAQAGSVGEVVCAQVTNGGSPAGCATNTSTPVSLTTGTAANVTSISLTAGDWDVRGEVVTSVNASTTIGAVSGWISTTSATLPAGTSQGASWTFLSLPFSTGQGTAISLAPMRLSLSSTTTVYLSAYSIFGVSTMSAFGHIDARRVR